jgi:hypothetical protein
MSVIYRPRHHPYIPNALTSAQIQTAQGVNDLPTVFGRERFFTPVIRRKSNPFVRVYALEEAEDNNDELVPFANKWKLLSPRARTRPNMDFPYPGGEDVIPPIILGTKALRHTQGRGPKTKLFTMRLGFRRGPSTR